MLCGGQTENVFGQEERWGKRKIIEAQQVPIYRCGQCGFETTEIDAVVEFLSKAVDKMVEVGDQSTARALRQELKLGLDHQKLFNESSVKMSQSSR